LVRERRTWQRGAILQALQDVPCHVTADELHRRVRQGRAIGLATVYRALDALVRDGLAEPVNIGDGKTRYGFTAKHHDHLVCLSCGRWEPLARCLVRGIPRRLASGFRVVGHQLEVYGYCVRCQKPAA
jgi:Fur family ferric uptake transcriptional regulator